MAETQIDDSAKPIKFSNIADGPMEINPNGDPDKIGKHYVSLHKVRCGEAYKITGQKVDIRYEKKPLKNGKTEVSVVVDHY